MRAWGLVAAGAAAAFCAGAAQAKAERLFDGRTLAGWEARPGIFKVEDGAIMAGSLTAPIMEHDYLCTARTFADFKLKLHFKLLGSDPNSGVQFRSRRMEDGQRVSGYQADLGQQYWGELYDEFRRNKTLAPVDDAWIKPKIRFNDWNSYEVEARGRRILIRLNGAPTVDYVESDTTIPQSGVICLQIHGGPPTEVRFKDIVITPY